MPAVSSSTPPLWTTLRPAPRVWPWLRPLRLLRSQLPPQPPHRKNNLGAATTTEPPGVAFLACLPAHRQDSQTALFLPVSGEPGFHLSQFIHSWYSGESKTGGILRTAIYMQYPIADARPQ